MTEAIIEALINVATPNGIFAVLFVSLFLFVIWSQFSREKKYLETIQDQNKRENEYQVIIRDYQDMTKKHQEIINDYNKKELNFQKIIQQLMNQIPLKLKKEISNVEEEVTRVKKDVESIKTTMDITIHHLDRRDRER